MEQNKTSKYLKYAIGEILLVVIGILIALSINNWNQERLNDLEEAQYYCKFKEDLLQDQSVLAEQRKSANERLTSSNILLGLLQKPKPDLKELAKYLVFSMAAASTRMKPTNIALDDLKSSGSLQLIRDLPLKNKLLTYYDEVQARMNVIDNNNRSMSDRFVNNAFLSSGGWMYLVQQQNGFDSTFVDVEGLFKSFEFDETSKTDLLNEVLNFTAINSRNIQHLDYLDAKVDAMKSILIEKCERVTND